MHEIEPGTVFWFTGLTATGKTTLSTLFHKVLLERGRPVILLDGDVLRGELYDGFGYSIDDRRNLAGKYGRLCRMLSSQGVDVVCATISLFHEVQRWNRANIENYREIYLSAPLEVLVERDRKGIYAAAIKGKRSDVMGVNLEIEVPENPDIHILNDGRLPPESWIEKLTEMFLSDQPIASVGAASR